MRVRGQLRADRREKMIFAQVSPGMRGASRAVIQRKGVLSSGKSKCKDPEAEPARRTAWMQQGGGGARDESKGMKQVVGPARP